MIMIAGTPHSTMRSAKESVEPSGPAVAKNTMISATTRKETA